MCVMSHNGIYTELDNVSGFGWKVLTRSRTGGLTGQVTGHKYHEEKWNHAKLGCNSTDYSKGFHIPLCNKELIADEMRNVEYCLNNNCCYIPVLVYVEYKAGHTLGEDYGPCIVANKMRIIDMYVMKKNRLVKIKKGLGRKWLKAI